MISLVIARPIPVPSGLEVTKREKIESICFWLYPASVVLHRNADTGTHVLGAEDNVPTRVGNSFLGIAQQVKKSLAHF